MSVIIPKIITATLSTLGQCERRNENETENKTEISLLN